ncbi:DDE-type integrase/transposase/recombinase [Candidatus Uhrbacteria bacterium]|nr:DDE-type integrase/transposase/recombinase [Candidatus Uhrbacteria bacterium]
MPKNHTPAAPREFRFRWYRQVEVKGMNVPEVCDIYGISRKTYYKWYKRDHGFLGNRYKNRREHPHTKIKDRVRVLLVEAKEKYNYGPEKMRVYLKRETGVEISAKNIYRFMKKKHLIRKPQKKQIWYNPMEKPYKATNPGENVQLDVKYVPDGEGWWNYQFRFVDTVTNMQYSVTLPLKTAQMSIQALLRAERSLPFSITWIQTDNGGEFRGCFHNYLTKRNIPHRYIPKRSAPWNGKVERANRSVDDEFYLNFNRPWKTISQYTNWYNNQRPHLGKGMDGLTPYEKYLSLTH